MLKGRVQILRGKNIYLLHTEIATDVYSLIKACHKWINSYTGYRNRNSMYILVENKIKNPYKLLKRK
jgi:hypothetical protein